MEKNIAGLEDPSKDIRTVRRAEETVDWSEVEEDSAFLLDAVERAKREMVGAAQERDQPHRKPHNFRELPDVAIDPEDGFELNLDEVVQIMLFGSCLPEKVLNDPAVAEMWRRTIRDKLMN